MLTAAPTIGVIRTWLELFYSLWDLLGCWLSSSLLRYERHSNYRVWTSGFGTGETMRTVRTSYVLRRRQDAERCDERDGNWYDQGSAHLRWWEWVLGGGRWNWSVEERQTFISTRLLVILLLCFGIESGQVKQKTKSGTSDSNEIQLLEFVTYREPWQTNVKSPTIRYV